ncbi:MAG: sterol desaturase family protein [Alphaproteobacteria bacterium]|nr:sterol desaturase family protein [Alphaproteobacteria bacterium]
MRTGVSYLLWPLLMAGAIATNYAGMRTAHPILCFNASYFLLAGALFLLERVMPHERRWLSDDGQLMPDLGHTLISKSAVQVLIVVVAVIGLTDAVEPTGAAWWPRAWPLAAQVVLGLAIAEIGFYWAHRLSHEWPVLWRFHAVHHSVKRLWFVNTGRFHFVDTIISVAFGLTLGLAVGVPKDIIVWASAITAYAGLLTHCNVEMRLGFLNYLFNTPSLHRWHHSMVPEEGNRNYGENLMFCDQLFGTFINPDRRPPADIGIREPMPATLLQQILQPFRRRPAPPSH